MAFSRIMLIAEAIARYNGLYISTSGGFKKAIAIDSNSYSRLFKILVYIIIGVKCTGGPDPSTCENVSLRSINFENAFLSP
jgi:hypothetical protein